MNNAIKIGITNVALIMFIAVVTSFAQSAQPQTNTQPGFALQDNDTIVFVGSTRMTQQIESGYLETLLTQASGEKPIRFRDLAWQADTVYLRQRPREFGSQLDWLQRVKATTLIAAYGQLESHDGPDKIPQFIEAYENILVEFAQQTHRIILITPTPFEPNPNNPNLPDLSIHNPNVALYAKAITQLAKKHNYLCINLSTINIDNLTTDGQQLNTIGQATWAKHITANLLLNPPITKVDQNSGAFNNKQRESLRQAILTKNILWRRHWRPTNWAFVYGNRQTQPSSHDHRPGMGRWFPPEIQAILPEIKEAERTIFYLHQ